MKCIKLEVWKRSVDLSIKIYRFFDRSKDFGFKDQITRSGLSIVSNIAEGAERYSDKETKRFFNIAKGSCAELYTQLYIGQEIGYMPPDLSQNCIKELGEISAMLTALIKRLDISPVN